MGRLAIIKNGQVENIVAIDKSTDQRWYDTIKKEFEIVELEDSDHVGRNFQYAGKAFSPIVEKETGPALSEDPISMLSNKIDALTEEIKKIQNIYPA